MEKLINLSWLAPEIMISMSVVLLLVFGVIGEKTDKARAISQQNKVKWLSVTTIIGSLIILISQYTMIGNSIIIVGYGLISISKGIIGTKIVLAVSSLALILMSLDTTSQENFEWSQLSLLALVGLMLVVSAYDLIMLYLGIELLSLSLYALASSKRSAKFSTEAGLKYFILGALSSGILLFGMGLIYISTGHTSYLEIHAFTLSGDHSILEIGALMIVVSLLFKLAAAPFHMWAPDVYEGAPTIVTAFFAIVPKFGILAALFNLLFFAFIGLFESLQPLLLASALLSIFVGSIGALNQTKIKRLLSYSAIAHIGFILLGFVPATLFGLQASFIYLLVYILMSINTFCVILSLFRPFELSSHPSFLLSQLVGLSRLNPALAINFALVILSIAGIPPLAGFLSKFLVLNSAIDAHFYFPALLAVLLSVIASFYYLRLIKWMFFKHSPSFDYHILHQISSPSLAFSHVSLFHSLLISSTLFFILTLLLYPHPLLFFSFDALFSFFF